jgi:hypothetical protein
LVELRRDAFGLGPTDQEAGGRHLDHVVNCEPADVKLSHTVGAEPGEQGTLLEEAQRVRDGGLVGSLDHRSGVLVGDRPQRGGEAVAAMREAIEAGWDGVPDGRCRVAKILTAAGRLDEATVIRRQVAGEFPDDVWVHNNAGIEYARAGEHETAVGCLTRGLELALGSGDPERLVATFSGPALAALGEETDEPASQVSTLVARTTWVLHCPVTTDLPARDCDVMPRSRDHRLTDEAPLTPPAGPKSDPAGMCTRRPEPLHRSPDPRRELRPALRGSW